MEKEKVVNYSQAMKNYDKSLGRKQEDTDLPLKYNTTEDGGVDYMAASKAYEKYLVKSGFIVSQGKKQKK